MANVDVISAVFGKTYEYQVMVKTILLDPTQDQCAPTEMKKNQNARPHIQRLIHDATTLSIIADIWVSPMKSGGNAR